MSAKIHEKPEHFRNKNDWALFFLQKTDCIQIKKPYPCFKITAGVCWKERQELIYRNKNKTAQLQHKALTGRSIYTLYEDAQS